MKRYDNWSKQEEKILHSLNTPSRIQEYLDQLTYNSTEETKSPRRVMMLKTAHCVEGALLAASCLRRIGLPPLIVDMRAINDDDHVIAVFQENKRWGAIAKSNFTTLRFRETVYRTLRELVMSYFDFYFNSLGDKTLRAYSSPLDLTCFDDQCWETTEKDLEFISTRLDRMQHYHILLPDQVSRLVKVSPELLKAGLLGSNPEGLYKPKL